jgi:hypothetical protein
MNKGLGDLIHVRWHWKYQRRLVQSGGWIITTRETSCPQREGLSGAHALRDHRRGRAAELEGEAGARDVDRRAVAVLGTRGGRCYGGPLTRSEQAKRVGRDGESRPAAQVVTTQSTNQENDGIDRFCAPTEGSRPQRGGRRAPKSRPALWGRAAPIAHREM